MWLREARRSRDEALRRAHEMTVFARALPAGSEVSMSSGPEGVVASTLDGSTRLDVAWGGARCAVVTSQRDSQTCGNPSRVDLALASGVLLPAGGPDEQWLLSVARAWQTMQRDR
jgi:hypothetical protein